MENKENKYSLKEILMEKVIPLSIALCLGAAVGFGFGSLGIDVFRYNHSTGYIIKIFILFILSTLIFLLAHIFIHEIGHGIFGYLTGYKLLFFRIGRTTIVMEKGKWIKKKMSIPGTLGQCMMEPPMADGDKFPFILYNIGGSILNYFLALVAIVISLNPQNISKEAYIIVIVFAFMGIFVGTMNILPFRIGYISNDGYNAYIMAKFPPARLAYLELMKCHDEIQRGKRLADIKLEKVDSFDYEAPMVCAYWILQAQIHIAQGSFIKGEGIARDILKSPLKVYPYYRAEAGSVGLFAAIMRDAPKETIDQLYETKVKRHLITKGMGPEKLRIRYAYELLVEGNREAADKTLIEFEKAAKDYPVDEEIKAERQFITLVNQKSLRSKMKP